MTRRILIIGSGGREHAIARQLLLETADRELFCAPGNPGTAQLGVLCVPAGAEDPAALADWCVEAGVELAVVGPEDPLIDGVADVLRARGVDVFGPGAAGARLEGDKAYAKEIMAAAGVPTAAYAVYADHAAALAHLDTATFPLVVKACGAAQGKGVAVCADRAAAEAHLRVCFLDDAFGAAGREVLIEECLVGPELSVLALTDGDTYALLAPSRDHKRVGEGDTGPNTGGMGAFASGELITSGLGSQVCTAVIEPVLAELRRRGVDYRGVLYVGLMLTADGPKVLEFNARFGDPETQVVLPLLQGDCAELLRAVARGTLRSHLASLPDAGVDAPAHWPGAALTDWTRAAAVVVGASEGYPGPYAKGTPLHLPDDRDSAWIIQAGTARTPTGLVTSGGRVLGAVGVGGDVPEALDRAYALLEEARFTGMHFRRDIAAGFTGGSDR